MDQRFDWRELQRNHEPRRPGVQKLGGVLAEVLEGPAFRRAARLAGVGAALGEVLPEGSRLRPAAGGFFVWAQLPETVDTAELLPRAERFCIPGCGSG